MLLTTRMRVKDMVWTQAALLPWEHQENDCAFSPKFFEIPNPKASFP